MRPNRLFALAFLLTPLALGACHSHSFDGLLAYPPQTRGNKVDPELLVQLVPGTSSRADATALIGSPTARGTFDDDTWIYISEVTKPVIAGTLSIKDQFVVVLTFDKGGVLRNVETRNQGDSEDVAVVSRTTPTPGSNATIMQQLLGNVGRFNAGSAAQGSKPNTIGGGGNNF